MKGLALPFRIAKRELRGGLKGFRVFLACLTLGVAVIAGVGSLSSAVRTGLDEDARAILGGDVRLRLTHRRASDDQLSFLRSAGVVSETSVMRSMARKDGKGAAERILVELKAIDGRYPLYASLDLREPISLSQALARGEDAPGAVGGTIGRAVWGAVVDEALLTRLGVTTGAVLKVGDARFEIRAVIAREPDRGTSAITLGPRLMIAAEALAATGLVQPGSLVRHYYRLKLPPGTDIVEWGQRLEAKFPDAGWQVRDFRNAAPGLSRFIDRMTFYLTLVGLSALLVGGIGVATAVSTYLEGRTETIAILKCIGAKGATIFAVYLVQIGVLALVGISAGIVIGALAPAAVGTVISDRLPVMLRMGFYPGPLALAALFGFLTAMAFSLWPLARAREVPAAGLFRQLVAPGRRWPRPRYIAATVAVAAALAALAIGTATEKWFAGWFVASAAGALVLFRLAAFAVMWAAKRSARRRHRPTVRLALANLYRPGAPTVSVVMALGIGLSVLVTVALIQGNITREVEGRLAEEAPAFFFIDIQPGQVAGFESAAFSVPGVTRIERMPTLRARIVRINGEPVDRGRVGPDAHWAVRGDRALTYAAYPPRGSRIVAGLWWPADYRGAALISLGAHVAQGLGIGLGDALTFNVLGRQVTGIIANLRDIDWSSLGLNFVVVFSPGTLETAPQSHIATAYTTPEAELPLLRRVTERFANVTAIRVRDILEAVARLVAQIGAAVSVTGAITLVVGTMVLAGAIAAGHHRRVYEAVVLKTIGATRADILRAFLVEYTILGAATAAIAAGLGTLGAWAVVTRVMHAEWTFLPIIAVATVLVSTVITVAFGFAGTFRALGRKAAPVLRNP